GDQPVAVAGGGGGHADDGLVEPDVAGGAVEGGVAEGEDAAVGGDQPVAVAGGGGGHADDGSVEPDVAGGAVVGGVAEGDDAAAGLPAPAAPLAFAVPPDEVGPVTGVIGPVFGAVPSRRLRTAP